MVAVETVAEARELLADAFATQLQRAVEEGAAPNEAVEGDARVRRLFGTLLPPQAQRAFFLERIADRAYWPRLRSLVGTPPYDFLMPEDTGLLNAAGICRGRANMAHLENVGASSVGGFGSGHFLDDAKRNYKVVARRGADASTLPWRDLASGHSIVADVRLKCHRLATKKGVLSGVRGGIRKESLAFPRPGDELTLSPVAAIAHGVDAVRARVTLGRQNAIGSHIARLVLQVM